MTESALAAVLPRLPVTDADERAVWLRLIRSRRVGPTTFWRLMDETGSAAAALEALPQVAAAAGVDDYAPCPEGVVAAELAAGRRAGARLVALPDPAYPAALRDLADAPPLLWVRGEAAHLNRPSVALVGARNASSLGTRMAARLGRALSGAGLVVVSGLARGIDAAAHQAALPATVAVCAGGVDVIYPQENADLAGRIAADGALVSDQPMGLVPQARHFPARNRLVSGLAGAVVVVEAAAKSGSLITARTALDQGRDVLAVPGHPFDARAAGCNLLIRDGATLVRGPEDVLEALGPLAAAPPRAHREQAPQETPAPARPASRPLREIAALHRVILDRLGPSPMAEDQLIRDLGTPASAVSPALTDLELEGRISRQPGGLVARLN
ncbi:DNA-processing protein DprA [Wenxinia marina]|uniref:DNA protecting protein DprA n=1 Tax=Wenxinia marina DSM 24838 TaxID=1123501 RepID=A0A0D0NHZ4_9RHOB|nr:DNA-processing protein DprA [Wenxinia marina]KIQ67960.1 DNA protecting protein DprA [Wenxinia marina DSM 24838]GGL75902.1 DNA processing protein DprA [Wenxinia marina]